MRIVDRQGLMAHPEGTLYVRRVIGRGQVCLKGETVRTDGVDDHWFGTEVAHLLLNEPAALGPMGHGEGPQYFVLEPKELSVLRDIVDAAMGRVLEAGAHVDDE